MNEDILEMLVEDMGLSFCNVVNGYVSCGPQGSKDCANCKENIEFEKMIEKMIKEDERRVDNGR